MKVETVNIQNNEGSQAIRIPDDFKINDDKVYIKKVGNALYIIPFHNPWQNLFDSLENFTSDFMADRNQSSEQTRESFDGMNYILDTNICIYLIKRKPVSVFERLNEISPGQIGISVITIAELYYGARKSSDQEKNLSALNQFLITFEIFNFDYFATLEYGKVRSEFEKKGVPIGPLDTLIAAHAKSLNRILVTNNEREF